MYFPPFFVDVRIYDRRGLYGRRKEGERRKDAFPARISPSSFFLSRKYCGRNESRQAERKLDISLSLLFRQKILLDFIHVASSSRGVGEQRCRWEKRDIFGGKGRRLSRLQKKERILLADGQRYFFHPIPFPIYPMGRGELTSFFLPFYVHFQ